VYGLLGAVTGILVAAQLAAALTLYGAALLATMAEQRSAPVAAQA
jgi:uncharacterized BrkB/YihY/UPF0761 family membrane protein